MRAKRNYLLEALGREESPSRLGVKNRPLLKALRNRIVDIEFDMNAAMIDYQLVRKGETNT